MFKKILFTIGLFFCISLLFSQSESKPISISTSYQIKLPSIIVQRVKSEIKITPESIIQEIPIVYVNGIETEVKHEAGSLILKYTFDKAEELSIRIGSFDYSKKVTPIPIWMSILPPLIAIMMALLVREVYSALFFGILIGTTIIWFYQGSTFFEAIFQGLFSIIDTYVLESMTDPGHLSIIIFSMLIGGMVNIITKNGGMKGVVAILSRYANSPRSGQLVTWILGVAIFFDDYANTLVVGNTMRPITDKLRVSREKLAYIVDSTAAPVAAIAFVTTWIGAELSYIQDGINTIGLDESAYNIFINSLAYSFYPIFTLAFILMLVYKKVDFGPMLTAERKARKEGIQIDEKDGFSNKLNDLDVDENIKARWYNAAIPVLVIIIGTFAGLLYTGWDSEVWNSDEFGFSKKLSTIIGNADSYKALLWSSISGVLVAFTLSIGQRILSLKESIDSLINGFRTMLTAVIILVLAWSLAMVTEHLHTADFISQSMLALSISPYLIPTITFILASLIAFSTGSSWGTMAILYPLLLPASWLISQESGMDYNQSMLIFYNVVSAVLAGSVLGDHCSPISDTTILSSLASSCNHIEHVRTQLPYALTVGAVAITVGTLPAAFGISSWILFPVGIIILYIIIKIFGRKSTV